MFLEKQYKFTAEYCSFLFKRGYWMVYIPATVFSCSEGEAPAGPLQEINDFGKEMYGGLCPPKSHAPLFFKLYDLKQTLNLPKGATKLQSEEAMRS